MKDCIIQKILFLINNELKICENPILPNEITDNLLVSKGMVARDLLVLFCEIEKTFNIKISEFAFEHYGFKNIENMADTVIYEMNRNENRSN